jgi:hypothetical protein
MDLNPAHRLGMRGIDEIKAHPAFKDYDWDAIERGTATLRGWEDLRALVCRLTPHHSPPHAPTRCCAA